MKKIILTLISLLVIIVSSAQSKLQPNNVVVKLKNGVSISGVLVTMDPSKEIILQIGGNNQKFSMYQIQSIGNINNSNDTTDSLNLNNGKLAYGKYTILDQDKYPDSIRVNIDGDNFTFYLILNSATPLNDSRHSCSKS